MVLLVRDERPVGVGSLAAADAGRHPVRAVLPPRQRPSLERTASLFSSRRASAATHRAALEPLSRNRRATSTAAAFRSALRLPIWRRAQLTALSLIHIS